MAKESGIETPTADDLVRIDRARKGKKLSNEEWISKIDPQAKIAKLKDGRTQLADKPEHAVDLDTGVIVAAALHPADEGDTTTIAGALATAETNLAQVSAAPTRGSGRLTFPGLAVTFGIADTPIAAAVSHRGTGYANQLRLTGTQGSRRDPTSPSACCGNDASQFSTGDRMVSMAQTALSQLEQHLEALRQEAYAAGYAAAMQAIQEFAGKPAPTAAAPARRQPAAGAAAPASAPSRRRQQRMRTTVTKPPAARHTAGRRPPRGTNAQLVAEVLQASAPRALAPAEIRKAIQSDKGVSIAFTSIRHALGQLEARQAAQQVGDKTWRHRESAAASD